MDLLFKIAQFILVISVLVISHEFGHYLPAKLFKTKVEKFFLFFDAKFALFQKKIGETTWGIGWLPLGGYVKIAGMIDESMDKEQMAKPPQPWEFRSKPAWQRLIIMSGGVIVNFLLAWVIFSGLIFTNGETYIPTQNLKHGIYADSVAQVIGLKTGDKILKVDGDEIHRMSDATLEIILGEQIQVDRRGQELTLNLTDEHKKMLLTSNAQNFIAPRIPSKIGFVKEASIAAKMGLKVEDEVVSMNGKKIPFWRDWVKLIQKHKGDSISIVVNSKGKFYEKKAFLPKNTMLGVSPSLDALLVTDDYTFLESIPAGFRKTISSLSAQVRQLKVLLNTKTEAYKQVSGMVGIVSHMPTEWSGTYILSFMAMFSVWLAFLNLLPIPALDGGHIMFLIYEIISGKKPSQRVLEIGQIIGLLFVVILTLSTLYLDVSRIVNN